MIIDPKIQNMFDRCREQKQHIDRMKRLIRTVMFLPPAVILALMALSLVLETLSSFLTGIMGGLVEGSSVGPVSLILYAAVAVFTVCNSMLEIQGAMKISTPVYAVSAAVCGIFAFLLRSETVLLAMLALLCAAVIPLDLCFKKYCAEDEMMKPLKGYPHFNILLMSEKELKEKETPDKKKLDEMTPDERLMYERDNW